MPPSKSSDPKELKIISAQLSLTKDALNAHDFTVEKALPADKSMDSGTIPSAFKQKESSRSHISMKSSITTRSIAKSTKSKSIDVSILMNKNKKPKRKITIGADHYTEVFSWGADHQGQLGLGLLDTGFIDENVPGAKSNNT